MPDLTNTNFTLDSTDGTTNYWWQCPMVSAYCTNPYATIIILITTLCALKQKEFLC